MSVVGIGVDIVDVDRIRAMSNAVKTKLAKRVLVESELVRYEQHKFPDAFLAKRWAAKEAAAKALGTGIAKNVSFQHFEILANDNNQPILTMSGEAKAVMQSKGGEQCFLSLSDEEKYAIAYVVLSK
ncbi:holo-ACP synthase [Thalassotalea agarivorans]|uniref:Holo-[acyl-carrier-protein] synthase n=1 Tax=Thalassotalea agarivorans TaxID=349064 RepID=A0A1I0FW70_THASX|nr:holo-ACP synthase [Thalassotalea agarivorans]SET62777.1 holo-[acyl-carrier protein] synthase [Thalassotalea agarivorans]